MKWVATTVAALVLGMASPAMAQAQFGGYGFIGLQIAVVDDAKSIAFYKILGLKPGRQPHPGHQEMSWSGKPGDGPMMMLVHKDANNPQIPGTALVMMFVPDLLKTVADLHAAGFKDVPEVRRRPAGSPPPMPGQPDFTEHRIKDPDGNTVLLIGPTPR